MLLFTMTVATVIFPTNIFHSMNCHHIKFVVICLVSRLSLIGWSGIGVDDCFLVSNGDVFGDVIITFESVESLDGASQSV